MNQLSREKYKEGLDELDTVFMEQYNVKEVSLHIEILKRHFGNDDNIRKNFGDSLICYYENIGNCGNVLNGYIAKWFGCFFEIYLELTWNLKLFSRIQKLHI